MALKLVLLNHLFDQPQFTEVKLALLVQDLVVARQLGNLLFEDLNVG